MFKYIYLSYKKRLLMKISKQLDTFYKKNRKKAVWPKTAKKTS